MKRLFHPGTGALCASLLAACIVYGPQRERAAPSAHAEVLLATERGMRNIVFDARHGYLSLSNTACAGTLVLCTGQVVNRASSWIALDLEQCALGPARNGEALRSRAWTARSTCISRPSAAPRSVRCASSSAPWNGLRRATRA